MWDPAIKSGCNKVGWVLTQNKDLNPPRAGRNRACGAPPSSASVTTAIVGSSFPSIEGRRSHLISSFILILLRSLRHLLLLIPPSSSLSSPAIWGFPLYSPFLNPTSFWWLPSPFRALRPRRSLAMRRCRWPGEAPRPSSDSPRSRCSRSVLHLRAVIWKEFRENDANLFR